MTYDLLRYLHSQSGSPAALSETGRTDMSKRSIAVTAAIVGAAALAATGINYAAAAGPEAAPVSAPAVQKAAAPPRRRSVATRARATRRTVAETVTVTVTVAVATTSAGGSTSTSVPTPRSRAAAASPWSAVWARGASTSATTAGRRLRSSVARPVTTGLPLPRSDRGAPATASSPTPSVVVCSCTTASWAASA